MLLFVLSFETVTESHTLFENRTPCSTSYTCLFYRRRFVASLWKMHYYIRIPCETYNNMVKKKGSWFCFSVLELPDTFLESDYNPLAFLFPSKADIFQSFFHVQPELLSNLWATGEYMYALKKAKRPSTHTHYSFPKWLCWHLSFALFFDLNSKPRAVHVWKYISNQSNTK